MPLAAHCPTLPGVQGGLTGSTDRCLWGMVLCGGMVDNDRRPAVSVIIVAIYRVLAPRLPAGLTTTPALGCCLPCCPLSDAHRCARWSDRQRWQVSFLSWSRGFCGDIVDNERRPAVSVVVVGAALHGGSCPRGWLLYPAWILCALQRRFVF